MIEIKFISEQKGRGVFAKKNIKKNTIVNISHVLLISDEDYELIQNTILYNYIYEWGDPKINNKYKSAIPLGMCQFFNHSYEPNLKYEYDYENKTIIHTAIKDILKGEELWVNYNGRIDDKSPMWFEVE